MSLFGLPGSTQPPERVVPDAGLHLCRAKPPHAAEPPCMLTMRRIVPLYKIVVKGDSYLCVLVFM